MPTNEEYETEIKKRQWPELSQLWERIKARDTPGWPEGKAFEYLVLRMFDLDNARVRWPYGVSLFGGEEEVEEIDGSVRVGTLYGLVESKDKKGKVDITPMAKLRNQLLRRPAGTIGFVFSSSAFTGPALALARFALPQAILLWSGNEVEKALAEEKICDYAELKFRICVDQGMPDYDITDPQPKRTPL